MGKKGNRVFHWALKFFAAKKLKRERKFCFLVNVVVSI